MESIRRWRAERAAARAERRTERALRLERDNPVSAERRAARIDAEARRHSAWAGHAGTPIGRGG